MIKVESISKRFDDVIALKEVTLNIQKGSIFGTVGRNGAGKTTLLKILTGVYKPDSGSVFCDGEPVFENPLAKSKIFFVPDNPYFFGSFSIYDMANFYKGIYNSWDSRYFENLLKIFNLPLKKRISKFSKGMQKQCAVLFALSSRPEVLVLDEPFDGLDPVIRQSVKKLLIEDVADRSTTVIISSHNLRELEDFCDTIAILHEGKVVLCSNIEELKSDTCKIQAVFKKNFLPESLSRFKVISYSKKGNIEVIIAKGNREEILDTLKGFEPVVLDILPLSLEEIFIYEMGGLKDELVQILD
ncbi:ABC transporter ATP-binding protein [Caldicellulosiruptor acetigenus]|uniref:ABC transporter ATP-binding protein n=1 Tax=Caldicellulosiruptor acetigenus TaxID=301953 RepID=UPI0004205E1E|nr:ABC transporter ATP-binding protein [Caldicellulosiruptor acetigenus]WAM36705.1 ABC transporter ATP-binding protein [Caldicellulosiruptor acetigenus]